MANPEHLKILKQGVEAWNQWRRRNPETKPNLHGANLGGVDLVTATLRAADLRAADLRAADLRNADLHGADLGGADLREADLGWADLGGANLHAADLFKADLCGANLFKANLGEADLVTANLRAANLRNADLRNADLDRVVLYETIFSDTNLVNAKGLDQCQHLGPSNIDYRTLQQNWPLPLSFLRGCGLPDIFIEFLPSLLAGPAIQFYSCFISYSAKDQAFAERLHADLQDKGVRCWYAPEKMKGGEKLYDQIDMAIRVHDKLLLLLSPWSMESEWVKTELIRTLKAEKQTGKRKLFPLRLVGMEEVKNWECFDADFGKDLAAVVREYFIPDFSNWKDHDAYQASFDRLLRDLKESTLPAKGG